MDSSIDLPHYLPLMPTDPATAAKPETPRAPLRLERRGSAAIMMLDRPEAHNALTIAMRAEMTAAVATLSRDPLLYVIIMRSAVPPAFSVGGDVREMTGLAARDLAAARQGLADELKLCWLMECLWKPTVSFIDGRVMGTGVGISLYNTHRVAGENYRFSMPETQIGYFPDCGVAHAFARMPHAIGLYLGLTGHELGPADAYALGLVTHCISAAGFGEIEARLADADPIDPLLDDAHLDPGPSPLLANAAAIERVFTAPSLHEIVRRLEASGAPDEEFRAKTVAALRARSPIALAVTDRLIRNARDLDVRGCLIQDYRLAYRFAELADFREGVRAFLIDKDGKPRWQPARVEDVTEGQVLSYFAPLGADELALETRGELQARR